MRRQSTGWVVGTATFLVMFASLGTRAVAHDATWETAPVLQIPATWQAAAVEHWRAMPDVPTVEQACGTMPTTRRVPDTGSGEAAWGRTRGTFTIRTDLTRASDDPAAYEARDLPCAIWFEEDRLTLLATLPALQRGRMGCDDYTHELGHALGLSHEYRGDAGSAMTEDGHTPECAKAFPAAATRCHARKAQHSKRWRRAHPRRAQRCIAG